MRPVTQTDLMAAARVLLVTPAAARETEAAGLINQAVIADAYRRETGRLHPRFGNGSVVSAALAHPQGTPEIPGDREYLSCMALFLDVLLARASLSKP